MSLVLRDVVGLDRGVKIGLVIVVLGGLIQCTAEPPEPSVDRAPSTEDGPAAPSFEAVQPDLFGDSGAQPNAWADYDGDGDLDLFVGFRKTPNRLYRNDEGLFSDVASDMGIDDLDDTRVAAWGDFDGDGHVDLFVGFPFEEGRVNRLYRNRGGGQTFIDVAVEMGVEVAGTSRQASFVDYDSDGDLDLFVALRDRPNRLFRNDGTRFEDVSTSSGIDDARRTVGVAWFDMDEDGDLDCFVTNQNGDADGFYRNDGGRFTDVAQTLGMHGGARSEEIGGVGPAIVDYDNDGDLDLFVAMYGPDVLWRNEGGGRFTQVSDSALNQDYHSTSASWGDYDNDGLVDLYVISYLRDEVEARDHLFRNTGAGFEDVTPAIILDRGGSHGVQWADFDSDGALDLSLANNNDAGAHPLYRNVLPEARRKRSLQVLVLDAAGHPSRPGAEVRIYRSDTGEVLGVRLVDSGGGYCSQSVVPVHFGVPEDVNSVDVGVTTFGAAGRQMTRVDNVGIGEGVAIVPVRTPTP